MIIHWFTQLLIKSLVIVTVDFIESWHVFCNAFTVFYRFVNDFTMFYRVSLENLRCFVTDFTIIHLFAGFHQWFDSVSYDFTLVYSEILPCFISSFIHFRSLLIWLCFFGDYTLVYSVSCEIYHV